ncbi:MAG: amino acid ABC transporter substrate-binding protein [Clostridioides sp.]|jgi:polar amino acid transport system substrate-binding protein|nr:amino acid ABC transporter substrate-binding protein [Clostridioides sp.]
MKKLGMLLTILVLVTGMAGCSTTANQDKGKDDKTVVVGFDNTFVPMGFLDDKGETVGFDVDLAKEAFKRIDKEVKFQAIDWSMKETELNAGNVDVLWNGYTVTEERKKQVNFTEPYLQNKQIIVAMKNSNIDSKIDLKGKEVGTQQGSSSVEAIEADKEFQTSLKDGKPVLYDTFDKALRDLEVGRTTAVVGDEVLIRYYISQKGTDDYKVLDDNLGLEDYAVGTAKKNKELADKIDGALKEMKDDGTYDTIYKKWFK